MARLLGLIFSARTSGNLYDLARQLASAISAERPEVQTELIEIAKHRVFPCNGCSYECLLGEAPRCPVEDDVSALWRSALDSDVLIYFIPTYGGMPPATWVAFQQRYHGFVRQAPSVLDNPRGKLAALTVYEPCGTKTGDSSQQAILKNLAGQDRPLVIFEQIIPSDYGLNSLSDRLVRNEAIRERLLTIGHRIVGELQTFHPT